MAKRCSRPKRAIQPPTVVNLDIMNLGFLEVIQALRPFSHRKNMFVSSTSDSISWMFEHCASWTGTKPSDKRQRRSGTSKES